MAVSKIEWTDESWNPVTGCTKISSGCKHCYAEGFAIRHKHNKKQRKYVNGFQLTVHDDKKVLEEPLRIKDSKKIFVCSMGDLFHKDVPEEFIFKVFKIMNQAPWHIFQVLTKRSERLVELNKKLPWAPHIWAGVTVENSEVAYRIDHLKRTDAAIKFISFEPLLGPIGKIHLNGIDLAIVGGETGPGARKMKEAWVQDIFKMCKTESNVAFFFKHWGGVKKKKGDKLFNGQVWDEMPEMISNNAVKKKKKSESRETKSLPVVNSKIPAETKESKPVTLEGFRLRIEIGELDNPDGPKINIQVPTQNTISQAPCKIAEKPQSKVRQITDKANYDFSAGLCEEATLNDLMPESIEEFRNLWFSKSGLKSLRRLTPDDLLEDAELTANGHLTYAALMLLGSQKALSKHIPNAKLIFECRPSESQKKAKERIEFHQNIFSLLDVLPNRISQCNRELPTFNEKLVREVLLNAIIHRDYMMPGPIAIKLLPNELAATNPGDFPGGISPDNIIGSQSPRNRRIADALAKCGLVYRAGQGVNEIFETCIIGGQPIPLYENVPGSHVSMTLKNQPKDEYFMQMMGRITDKYPGFLDTKLMLTLYFAYHGEILPNFYKSSLSILVNRKILARSGSNGKYIFSEQFDSPVANRGVNDAVTAQEITDRDQKKEILLKHIHLNSTKGAKFNELHELLPGHTRGKVQVLLRELKEGGIIFSEGQTKGAKWFPASTQGRDK